MELASVIDSRPSERETGIWTMSHQERKERVRKRFSYNNLASTRPRRHSKKYYFHKMQPSWLTSWLSFVCAPSATNRSCKTLKEKAHETLKTNTSTFCLNDFRGLQLHAKREKQRQQRTRKKWRKYEWIEKMRKVVTGTHKERNK
jgi:hypothetical protein